MRKPKRLRISGQLRALAIQKGFAVELTVQGSRLRLIDEGIGHAVKNAERVWPHSPREKRSSTCRAVRRRRSEGDRPPPEPTDDRTIELVACTGAGREQFHHQQPNILKSVRLG
jgi:hypothetical protein